MHNWTRYAAATTLAFLMITSYLLTDEPISAIFRFISYSSEYENLTTQFHYINESTERIQEGYLVWSSGCRIVDIPAWDKSLHGLVGKSTRISCPGKKLSKLQGPSYNRTLEISKSLESTSCCIQYITRKDNTSSNVKQPDDIYKFSKCEHINTTTPLSEDSQSVYVKCITKKDGKDKDVYKNIHSYIGRKKSVDEKLKIQTDQFKSGKMSVLLIGIDSVSRLNLLRTMPKTVKYLHQNGWIDLKGYNKVDDNTFPNLMAILTGRTVAQVKTAWWPTPETKMDNIPFIWKDFSEHGYITAYAEDEPSMSTFNYHKSGFAKSPTDYYSRPFMLAAEKYLKTKVIDGLHICTGPNYSVDFILDYALDFVSVFHNALYFALFWMNSFSHNDVNAPSAFDDRILKFLKDIEKTGTLNSTLVVLLSDHGMRFGKIRETFVGWLEERLPFIYFWLPKSFKFNYPDKHENLITNKNRLTSPYDFHLTLQEVINQEDKTAEGCKSCSSLWKEINWNRTCEEAGIGVHWCTCSEYKNLSPTGTKVEKMAQSVVEYINNVVKTSKVSMKVNTECVPLKLSRVLSLRSRVPPGPAEVVILLEARPGGALFEATLSPDKAPLTSDSISRINSYAKHSNCVYDASIKKFCFCKTKKR